MRPHPAAHPHQPFTRKYPPGQILQTFIDNQRKSVYPAFYFKKVIQTCNKVRFLKYRKTKVFNIFIFLQQVIFFCLQEPEEGCGGVTPIARNDDILARLDRGVVAKLKEKKIRYSRFLPSETPTSYVSWQQSFATDDARVSIMKSLINHSYITGQRRASHAPENRF